MTSFSDDFTVHSSKLWKQKIQFELQGKDYNSTMLSITNEGITIPPFCHIDTVKPLNYGHKNNPKIGQEISVKDEIEANKKVLYLVENGVSVFLFKAEKPFDYEQLFKGLLGKNLVFHFKNTFLSSEFITKLNSFLKDEKVFYNVDIIGNVAQTGNGYTTLKNDFAIIQNLLPKTPNLCSIQADIYQNAGANCVQQLAYTLSNANEYFVKYGSSIPQIPVHFAIGNQYFMEIAKLKAFRLLWDIFTKEYLSETKAIIVAVPSTKQIHSSLKINDFNQKIMSEIAELGGADYILTQNTEKEVSTTASNSYFIDYLTTELAKKSFELFQLIEKSGGFLQQLKKGTIQKKIRENARKGRVFLDKKIKNQKPVRTLFEPI